MPISFWLDNDILYSHKSDNKHSAILKINIETIFGYTEAHKNKETTSPCFYNFPERGRKFVLCLIV